MLARMLAIAGLIVAIARPMTAGWLGMTTGGAPELTVVVLDRSASMEQRDPTTGVSFRESSLNKLTSLLRRFDADTRVVLFDSATGTHQEVRAADDLSTLPFAGSTQTAADIPQLLESVAEYLSVNEAGRTDIWICSDMRQSDWLPSDGRWSTIRSQLQRNRGVRLYVLESDRLATDNLTVAVSNVHRRSTPDGAEVVMDIRVTRHTTSPDTITVPVTVTIDGATSLVELELIGQDVVRSGHAVPVASDARQGWGRVALPGDSNPADDEWYFVYAASADQRTTIVAEDRAIAEILSITAGAKRHT
jgi:hypothetical protein